MLDLPARPCFRDVKLGSVPSRYDRVMLKYDGHWTYLVLEGTRWTLLSRTKKVKAQGRLRFPMRRTVFVGEQLVGTHWAKKRAREDSRVDLVLFDIAWHNGETTVRHGFDARREILKSILRQLRLTIASQSLFRQFSLSTATVYPAWQAQQLWDKWVLGKDNFEGLIFRESKAPWFDMAARIKRMFDRDYVVMGTIDSESDRIAGWGIQAFRLGLYDGRGNLREVGQVGSMPDSLRKEAFDNPKAFIGRVIRVRGRGSFPSGALRHPSLHPTDPFNDEKPASECRLPRRQNG